MKRHFFITLTVLTLATATAANAQKKSALDDFQFDGVTSDRSLKRHGKTREEWLTLRPIEAREYWDAWDCKGTSCDSERKATIRKKAALIPRPKGASNGSSVTNSAGPGAGR